MVDLTYLRSARKPSECKRPRTLSLTKIEGYPLTNSLMSTKIDLLFPKDEHLAAKDKLSLLKFGAK